MKKGQKYKIKIHKFRTMLYSGYLFALLAYSFLFVISLTSLIINIFILAKYGGTEKEQMQGVCNIVIPAVSVVVSLVGTLYEFLNTHQHNYFSRQSLTQDGYKEELRKAVVSTKSEGYRKSGFKWVEYPQYYLVSDTVNQALFSRIDRLRIRVWKKKRALGKEQRETLYKIVAQKIAEGKNIFNDKLVRLRTDIFESLFEELKQKPNETPTRLDGLYHSYTKNIVQLEKTDYFSNLTTNDQIYGKFFKYDYSSLYCGKDMTLDAKNRLYDLSQSPAANIVGVTTLAITSDGFLVINRQNNNNDVNNNCFVPSGSGSSDFVDFKKCRQFEPESLRKDFDCHLKNNMRVLKKKYRAYREALGSSDEGGRKKEYEHELKQYKEYRKLKRYSSKMKRYTYSFKTFLTYGMVRELIEESHICDIETKKGGKCSDQTRKKLMDNTLVCGCIRILDRGGKPDFFGFTLMDFTKAQVEKMFERGRKHFLKKELSHKCRITDFNEVCEQRYVALSKLELYDNVADFIYHECPVFDDEGKRIEVKASLQMHCLFELLRKNKEKILNRIYQKTGEQSGSV